MAVDQPVSVRVRHGPRYLNDVAKKEAHIEVWNRAQSRHLTKIHKSDGLINILGRFDVIEALSVAEVAHLATSLHLYMVMLVITVPMIFLSQHLVQLSDRVLTLAPLSEIFCFLLLDHSC